MKHTGLLLLLLLIIPSLKAQTIENADADFGARLSVSAERKIIKGLHLQLEEEMRLADNFGSFGRFHTTLSVQYKPIKHLKLGLGYALINPYDSDDDAFKPARHRLMADATGIYNFGHWQLSLRERLQITHRSGNFNPYQQPRNAVMLKSRLMLKYKGLDRWMPYASAELRHQLNAPSINATYNSTKDKWVNVDGEKEGKEGWFLDGFDCTYLNRLRFTLGSGYKLSRQHQLSIALIADYSMERSVDANQGGTKLKAYTEERGLTCWLTAGYEFSF